ncbi:hypothetical protein QWY31_01200 [Cytophagales bacterium LB-30]|uniref:4-vinyl reductase 4VR domain-containing protein n=1 Tax=Shiella aurantiaca TaxID=3058365 RepID=A0ABT8F0W9_9BACT|nr:hypothetical protein [Shiella aurantiaca]MDN4164092.1 hypothetical protein [Shiella aurantiaca]
MAEFIPFDPQVEVKGEIILTYVNALPYYQSMIQTVLYRYGIKHLFPDSWYLQRDWLNAFRELSLMYGSHALFLIGKAIAKPSNKKSLKEALEEIDSAYHMCHRNGEIGYYKLTMMDHGQRMATMECQNPYPSYFDMGMIISTARFHKSSPSDVIEIQRDESKPSRLLGDDSCTYILKW